MRAIDNIKPAAVFLFGFALLTVYWPGISGAATSPRWALATMVVACVLFMGDRIKVTLVHVVGIAFVAWAAASFMWTAAPLDTIGALCKLAVLAGAFCVGAQMSDLRPLYAGSALGVAISSIVAIVQWCGYVPVPDLAPGNAAGLFVNRLILAETAALVGVAILASRMWWWLPGVLPSLLLPGERAPVLAFGLAGGLALWRTSRLAAVALAIASVAFIGAITGQSSDRVESAQQRIELVQSTSSHISAIGQGFGSYREAAPQPIAGIKVDHAHNELLEIAFEIGWIGALLLVVLAVSALFAAGAADIADGNLFSAATVVVFALMMESVFAFPLHEPATGFLGLLCAGHCIRALPGARVALADGGIRLCRWLASCRRLLALDAKPQRRRNPLSVRSPLS